MRATRDNLSSSYRESLIEHLFVGEIMRRLWLRSVVEFEVLHPEVDDSGYDLVLETGGIIRHIQLKSSFRGAQTGQVRASLKLLRKPSACVVWIQLDPKTMDLGPFLWFGATPGERMPDITHFRVAKHVRANSKGVKNDRPSQRSISRSKFECLPTYDLILERLFGDTPSRSD